MTPTSPYPLSRDMFHLAIFVFFPFIYANMIQNYLRTTGPNGGVRIAASASDNYSDLLDIVVSTASGDMGELIASASTFNANQTDPSNLIGIGSGNVPKQQPSVQPLETEQAPLNQNINTNPSDVSSASFNSLYVGNSTRQQPSAAKTTKVANLGPNGLRVSPYTLKFQGQPGGPPARPPSNRVTASSAAQEPGYFSATRIASISGIYNTFFSYAEPAEPLSDYLSPEGLPSCGIPNSKYDDWVVYLPPKIATNSPNFVGCLQSYCVKVVHGRTAVVLKYNGQGKGPNYTIQMSDKAYAELTKNSAPSPIVPVVWQLIACGIFPLGPSNDLLIDFRQSSSVINRIINGQDETKQSLPLIPAAEFALK